MLHLTDADPTFRFACSSAQQYAWIKQYYPELFDGITRDGAAPASSCRSAACGSNPTPTCPAARRWPASSSPAKRFFLDEFGVETEEVWLPDSFGYSAALPQIVRASGSRWFLTQKISWNQTNRLPHHTFWWEGIDGTPSVHPLPAGRHLQLRAVAAPSWRTPSGSTAEKGRGTTSLGAVRLRRRRRRADPGDARRGASARARPRGLADACGSTRRPRSSRGRGGVPGRRRSGRASCTSSSTAAPTPAQARTKQGNRRSEHLLREAELWARHRRRYGPAIPTRPTSCEQLWETVLLQQFHDILPGTSIAWVHREAERN